MDAKKVDERFLKLEVMLNNSMDEMNAKLDKIDKQIDSFENLANEFVKEASILLSEVLFCYNHEGTKTAESSSHEK